MSSWEIPCCKAVLESGEIEFFIEKLFPQPFIINQIVTMDNVTDQELVVCGTRLLGRKN